MKNLYSIIKLIIILSFFSTAYAYANDKGKEDKNGVPPYLEQAIAKLPDEDATQFRATMKEAHEKNMAIVDQIHALHDDIDDIVSAEPFDKDAFLAKSKQLRDVYDIMRSNTDEAFASAIEQLPQDERQTLAAAMSYPHTKHKKDATKTQ